MNSTSIRFLTNEGTTRIFRGEVRLDDNLPQGFYALHKDMAGFFLSETEEFVMPEDLYGHITKLSDRILTVAKDRSNVQTGFHFTGEKGTGKSLQVKHAAGRFYNELGYSVIVVSGPWCGGQFNDFVQSITEPCVFIFDEFEKVYSNDQQEEMLTLLDGMYTTGHVFFFTSNARYKVVDQMYNRPSRVYYTIDYQTLSEDIINEIVEHRLINKAHAGGLMKILSNSFKLNIDTLIAIIEDMNRFDESAADVIRYIPVSKGSKYSTYKGSTEIKYSGVLIDSSVIGVSSVNQLIEHGEASIYIRLDMFGDQIPSVVSQESRYYQPGDHDDDTDLANFNIYHHIEVSQENLVENQSKDARYTGVRKYVITDPSDSNITYHICIEPNTKTSNVFNYDSSDYADYRL